MNEFDRYPDGNFDLKQSIKLDEENLARAERTSALIEVLFDGLNKAAIVAIIMALLKVTTTLAPVVLAAVGALIMTLWGWFKTAPYAMRVSGLLRAKSHADYWRRFMWFHTINLVLCLTLLSVMLVGLRAALAQLPKSI